MKYTLDTKLPGYGDPGFEGDVYDIVRRRPNEKLTPGQKAKLLQSIHFNYRCALNRCPKYMKDEAQIRLDAIKCLIEDIREY